MATDSPEPDYYAVLEIAHGARPQVVHAAWRQLAKDYHPDLNPDDIKADQRLKLINAARDRSSPSTWCNRASSARLVGQLAMRSAGLTSS